MKTTKTLRVGLVLTLLSAAACSSRQAVLTVPAVSMTDPSFPEGRSAIPGSRVEGEYCRGDDPVVSKDSNVGMIDEAVMLAQQKSGAKYLTDVTVYQDGSCIVVEGTAMQ